MGGGRERLKKSVRDVGERGGSTEVATEPTETSEVASTSLPPEI